MSRPPSRRGPAALVLVVALVAAACSRDYDRVATSPTSTTTTTAARPAGTTTITPGTTTTTRPPADAPATTTTRPGPPTTTIAGSPAGLPGRLAVLALDGSLLTVRADGTDPRVLATASPGTSVSTPTWTPDASRLVWTALGTNAVRVRSATIDNTDGRDAALSPPASLFVWNPGGTDLLALRDTSTTTVELTRLDPATLASSALRSAASVFASWSPDGTRLLVHAGNDVLVLRPGTTTVSTVPIAAGSFGAPQWFDDKTALVARREGAAQVLSLVDVDTGTSRDLLGFSGAIRFLLDARRERVAFQVLPESGSSSGSNVSFRPQATTPSTTTTTPVPQATVGRLGVLTISSRAVTDIGQGAAVMFQWSPTGERLAYLGTEPNNAFRWHFWGASGTVDGPVLVPPNAFLRVYGRLFDQAAASVRWWSPDGAAFVFAGRVGARTGVFVQQMNGTAPVLVTDGDTAVWSPR